MNVGVALAGVLVDELGVKIVHAQHVPAPYLFSACEKYTNGMRIGNVMLKWTSSDVGISQNGASTSTAGTATRIIIRMAAPLPARSLRTQSRIESGSRAP